MGKHIAQNFNGSLRFIVRVHNPPYPTKEAQDAAGAPEPRLIAQGDFKGMDYWFCEADR
jgi:hypothetical protein